jgi:hypothetical protein
MGARTTTSGTPALLVPLLLSPCYAGFDVSPACIAERGLGTKVAAYQAKLDEAKKRLGVDAAFALKIVNNPTDAGYSDVGDVFTTVIYDDQMKPQSFVVNVTADFLERQPEILFESSSLHEVCHVKEEDLPGHNQNGVNVEVAEEACVLGVVGRVRYEEYLRAYAKYQHWEEWDYTTWLQRVLWFIAEGRSR